ncbi:Fur family transcriptional regulator [Halotalea alkalilenta]|uniref:Ferric uptake regulation protein n=1 Tax=Halotalea alkalilenta TaxID=376489 RepID=A0A172YG74_9GAMM|nr:Fur family transcriptional regulator [Halotalea alkalilenta]ANF58106.1 transcriptional repressor [Halotalea alkalilenta]
MHCDHTASAEQLVDIAEQRCRELGVRFTPIRRRVFELVSDTPGGLKAYELLDRLSTEHASARPPTVYRALDFLMEQGLVHRIESQNAFVACPCPEPRPDHHGGFQLMICRACGRVEEMHRLEVTALMSQLVAEHGYTLERQTVELVGLCPDCRSAA